MSTQSLPQTFETQRKRITLQLYQNQAVIIWICVVALSIFATIASPAFLTTRNLLNVLRQASVLGIIAVGQTLVILSAGADLSQSTVMTLAAVVAFQVLGGKNELIFPVILLSLFIGGVVGLVNGIFVSKIKLPPFILTLGTREIIFGIGLVFTHGAPQSFITPLFRQVLGRNEILGIPGQVIIWSGVVIVGWLLLSKTTYGRQLYAAGGNLRCARQSGIKAGRVVIAAYVISGILAALGGLVLGARSGNAGNMMGNGYELNAVAAVVIGGTPFTGGRGGLFGTIGGVLLMTVLQNVLNILGANPDVYLVAMGMVIVMAVALIKGDKK